MYENIKKMIPFVDENFIRFELWEEGVYIPSVHFWKIINRNQLGFLETFDTDFSENNREFRFDYDYDESRDKYTATVNFKICPKFVYNEKGGIEHGEINIEKLIETALNFLTEFEKYLKEQK